ncbi:hypothetical protein HFN51_04440 [Rhizobium leguminosarum]|nr:hypothetical protein [Rhizobium leguminosarum]
MSTPIITKDVAYTALCLWEAWLEDSEGGAWGLYKETFGTVHVRYACIEMAPVIEEVWALIPEENRDLISYDWEFVPAMLPHFGYPLHGFAYPTLIDDVATVAGRFTA